MENLPMKIKNIIIGIHNYYNKPINNNRYQICNKCENILIMDNTQFCNICGCIIKYKISSPDEKCPINKW